MASQLEVLAGTFTTGEQMSRPAESQAEVLVIPYDAALDREADKFLPWFWQRLKADGLVDLYFPGTGDTGFSDFVKMFSGGAQIAIFCLSNEQGQADKPIGFISWTNMPLGTVSVAVAGFIFFKQYWGHGVTDAAAEAAFTHWFTKTENAVILGACPAKHLLAMRFNKRIGLRESGRIPDAHVFKGEPCDAILFTLTKKEWLCHSQQ